MFNFLKRVKPPKAAKPEPVVDYAALGNLRAEVQDLQKILHLVGTGQASLSDHAGYIKKTTADISVIVGDLKEEGDWACTIRHIRNLWEQMKSTPVLVDPATALPAQEQTRQLSLVASQIRDIVFQIGFLTIPNTLNMWLEESRPGHYVPFHDVFDDEIPDSADRTKLLDYLSWSPKGVPGGLIDSDTGLVYRYSKDWGGRIVSYVLLAIAILAAVGIVAGMAYIPTSGWPLDPSNLSTLLVGWLAVVAGVIVHVGVGTAKSIQSKRGRPPVMAIGDLPLLVNAKLGQALLKVLMTLVGFLGLVFAAGIENTEPWSAFLVGYSLDSVVELFSASIEQKATTQLSSLKQQLGVASKT